MKFRNLNLIWNELNYFEGKITEGTVHSGPNRPAQIRNRGVEYHGASGGGSGLGGREWGGVVNQGAGGGCLSV
jgi:hypothetical protein